jgi:hypothetical protein
MRDLRTRLSRAQTGKHSQLDLNLSEEGVSHPRGTEKELEGVFLGGSSVLYLYEF